MIVASAASFHPLDWTVLAAYMLLVIAMGVFLGRKHRGADEFFLAGRSMPMWAVAISVLATSQSAATFVGGPQQAFDGNLTYFSANLGALLAVVLVAIFFIPAYYRQNVTSVYELIGHHYGATSQRLASGMFIVGRIFASGARLFIVAIPFALIAFGDISARSMIGAIVIIAAAAAAYTLAGGIRAVIWTDVVQAIVYIACIVFALALVWQKIPLSFSEIIDTLRQAADGDKLTIVDFDLTSAKDLAKPYGFWAIIIGLTLFNLAAFGTDQDLTQRMLTCRSARHGSWSVIIANLIGWPVVFMFLCMGLLLYVYYQQPDVMGAAAVKYQIDDTRKVFLEFILHEMPLGLRGLMLAGLFAAAMSSTDSALNAMASTTVADFYRPLAGDHSVDPGTELKVARLAVLFWALVLGAFACFCVYWQKASGQTLIDFALNVMVFAYSGLLAVFCTALFTRRGNAVSVAAALATGFLCVLLLQDFAWTHWAPWFNIDFTLAFPWKMLLATLLSFVVCCLGKRTTQPATVDSPS